MIVGVVTESFPKERRVALIPADLPRLAKTGVQVTVQKGAGDAAGFVDDEYRHKGATIAASRQEVMKGADLLAQVRGLGANPVAGVDDVKLMNKSQALIAFLDPLAHPAEAQRLAEAGITAFAMDLMPRITRAQSMDALSSMANLAGYHSVLLAATRLPKLFPMMMTAAGTIHPAKVFVLGVGVAGLQAIATARRLGAVVEAYDIRPEVKDQVQSVGGKFVDLQIGTTDAGGSDGYAQEQSKDLIAAQQEALAKFICASDAIITTAAIPGKKAPVLITQAMMQGMRPGALIIDLAAETGGNCAVTKLDEIVVRDGVSVFGPGNVPSEIPHHASQLYSRNVTTFIQHLVNDEGELVLDFDDEITAATLVSHDGEIKNSRVRDAATPAG